MESLLQNHYVLQNAQHVPIYVQQMQSKMDCGNMAFIVMNSLMLSHVKKAEKRENFADYVYQSVHIQKMGLDINKISNIN